MIELQTMCQKFLLTIVEMRKAKLAVKVFLGMVYCTCVTLVTAGHMISLFPVLGGREGRIELFLSQLEQRRVIPFVTLLIGLMKGR